jgi:hypothetical protein
MLHGRLTQPLLFLAYQAKILSEERNNEANLFKKDNAIQ